MTSKVISYFANIQMAILSLRLLYPTFFDSYLTLFGPIKGEPSILIILATASKAAFSLLAIQERSAIAEIELERVKRAAKT